MLEQIHGSSTLIPMGDWYGSPYRTYETSGAQPRNELVLPESDRPEPTNSRKGEVSGVDKGLLMGVTSSAVDRR